MFPLLILQFSPMQVMNSGITCRRWAQWVVYIFPPARRARAGHLGVAGPAGPGRLGASRTRSPQYTSRLRVASWALGAVHHLFRRAIRHMTSRCLRLWSQVRTAIMAPPLGFRLWSQLRTAMVAPPSGSCWLSDPSSSTLSCFTSPTLWCCGPVTLRMVFLTWRWGPVGRWTVIIVMWEAASLSGHHDSGLKCIFPCLLHLTLSHPMSLFSS